MADDTFAPVNAAQQPPHIYQPIPRRTFDTQQNGSADSPTHDLGQITPPSATETRRSPDFLTQLNARLLRTYNSRNEDEERESELGLKAREKSFLNLTSSTLSGIYDEVDSSLASSAETPWGTGAETPAHLAMGHHTWNSGLGSPDGGLSMKTQARRGIQNHKTGSKRTSQSPKRSRRRVWKHLVLVGKLTSLFLFGVVYGWIVSHLHDTKHLAAVRFDLNSESWIYLGSWGFAGVALGSLLPYVDLAWSAREGDDEVEETLTAKDSESPISEQVNDVVRSVAAFVGIAFAIRRLPWQSTLQLTLTLALVNPALWYILDRSRPGLSFSLIVTSIVTSFIFLSNPNVLPSPSLPIATNMTQPPRTPTSAGTRSPAELSKQELFIGMISYENLAVVTWVGSVLFCSCVCFGSIGRRLAVLEESGWKK